MTKTDKARAAKKFREAIGRLGGQADAASIVKRSQPTISDYCKNANAPAEVCMRIEAATNGEFLAEHLRPDLAADFAAYRDRARAAA